MVVDSGWLFFISLAKLNPKKFFIDILVLIFPPTATPARQPGEPDRNIPTPEAPVPGV